MDNYRNKMYLPVDISPVCRQHKWLHIIESSASGRGVESQPQAAGLSALYPVFVRFRALQLKTYSRGSYIWDKHSVLRLLHAID